MKIVQPINLQLFAEDKPDGKEVVTGKKEVVGEDKKLNSPNEQEQKVKSYEEIYNEQNDKEFLIKTIISLEKNINELRNEVINQRSGNFTASEVKSQNNVEDKNSQEPKQNMIEVDWKG